MSTYITLQGQITYPHRPRFNDAVKALKNGQWMNADGCCIDEAGTVVGDGQDPDVDLDALTVTIPLSMYRNLGYILDELVKGCKDAWLVWTSTDGGYDGGVYKGEHETEHDLLEFAKTLDLGELPHPSMGQEHCDWLTEVENAFHEDHS